VYVRSCASNTQVQVGDYSVVKENAVKKYQEYKSLLGTTSPTNFTVTVKMANEEKKLLLQEVSVDSLTEKVIKIFRLPPDVNVDFATEDNIWITCDNDLRAVLRQVIIVITHELKQVM